MPSWKLILAYDGSGFHGWQIQPRLPTVQGTLAEALYRITGERVLPQGAGRTDAGVHASGQVASFALNAPVPAQNLQRALNRILPDSVRVLSAEIVAPSFHARHSARGKVYEYRLFERRLHAVDEKLPEERICSPFQAPFVWDCRWPLHVGAMQQATPALLGTHDFSAFAASSSRLLPEEEDSPLSGNQPNPVKTIYEAGWARTDDLLVFRIRGSGFLHHMVRNIVGTLVDIGRGSLLPGDLARIIASGDRAQAGPTAPASGLFLLEVQYPPESCAVPSGDPRIAEAIA